MKKIFITGGLGYLGSKLAQEALAKGFSVFLYDSLLYGQDAQKILAEIESKKKAGTTCQFIVGDTRDTSRLKKALADFRPDFLFHFAELVGIYVCNDQPDYTKEINFEASKKVIDLAEELKIPLIYNSTSSLYGNRKENLILDEQAFLPETTDNYCQNKLQMEKYIINKKKQNPNFKIIILRPATVYGQAPRMRLELMPNHFTYCALAKKQIKISEPESFRAEINIDDLVEAYFAIMTKNSWPKLLYNIGHDNLPKIQVAQIIQSVFACEIDVINNLGDSRNLQIDSSAFSKDFAWEAKHNLKETVLKTGNWIKENQSMIEKTNFAGLINSPLDQWLKII